MPTTRHLKKSLHVPALSVGEGKHTDELWKLLEDKTDRRATGSYYTPASIVRQVVDETLGPLVKALRQSTSRRTAGPSEAGAGPAGQFIAPYLNLRILDPAMGCGNFLLSAADYLFEAIQVDASRRDGRHGDLQAKRIRRLVVEHCLYGVDSHPAAVEHAKAALAQWAGCQPDLPALDEHLRCGNSLLSARLVEDLQVASLASHERSSPENRPSKKLLLAAADCWLAGFFDPSIGSRELEQIQRAWHDSRHWAQVTQQDWFRRATTLAQREKRCFHWELEFADVLSTDNGTRLPGGGFDAVIGNPPYVDSASMSKSSPDERRFCTTRWPAATGNWDLFVPFVELSLECTRPGGFVGLVLPNKLLAAEYCAGVRTMLKDRRLLSIRDYSEAGAFEDANVYPITVVLQNDTQSVCDAIICGRMTKAPDGTFKTTHCVTTRAGLLERLPDNGWQPLVSDHLEALCQAFRGTRPLAEVAQVSDAATVAQSYAIGHLIQDGTEKNGDACALRLVNTGAIERYFDTWLTRPIRYLRETYRRPTVPREKLAAEFPKRSVQATTPKIVLAGLTKRLEATHDGGDVLAGKSTVIVRGAQLDPRFLLALLNSRLMSWIYQELFGGLSLAGGYLQVNPRQVGKLPVRKIAFRTPSSERARLRDESRSLYRQSIAATDTAPLLSFIERQLTADHAGQDVVHDALTDLADVMFQTSRTRQEEIGRYYERLEERIAAPIDSLRGKTVLRRFHQHGWTDVWKTVRTNRSRLTADVDSPDFQIRLQADFEHFSREIRQLDARLSHTDQIIDECVFRLYGISKRQQERLTQC